MLVAYGFPDFALSGFLEELAIGGGGNRHELPRCEESAFGMGPKGDTGWPDQTGATRSCSSGVVAPSQAAVRTRSSAERTCHSHTPEVNAIRVIYLARQECQLRVLTIYAADPYTGCPATNISAALLSYCSYGYSCRTASSSTTRVEQTDRRGPPIGCQARV